MNIDNIDFIKQRLKANHQSLVWQQISYVIYIAFLSVFVILAMMSCSISLSLSCLMMAFILVILYCLIPVKRAIKHNRQFLHFYRNRLMKLDNH